MTGFVVAAATLGSIPAAGAHAAGPHTAGSQRATVPTPPYYAMSMVGPVDVVSMPVVPPPAVGAAAVTATQPQTVTGAGFGDIAAATFTAASDLPAGHYTVGAGHQAALVIASPYLYCDAKDGAMDVLESQQDARLIFSKLAVDYSVSCANGRTYTGVVRFNSSVSFDAVSAGVGPIDFGTVREQANSAVKTVTLTNEGVPDHHFTGPATLTGLNPTSFVITDDTCDGATLASGETCSVSLVARPVALNLLSTVLTVPDAGSSGGIQVLVKARSIYDASGKYKPTGSWRVLDTRKGTGAPKHVVLGGHSIRLVIGGRNPVIAGRAASAVLNLTVVGATSAGFVTVYPAGSPRPNTSSINFPRGWTGSNQVTVKLGTSAAVDLYLSSGSANLVADLVGYYGTASTDTDNIPYHPELVPSRIYDSRTAGGRHTPLASHFERQLAVGFDGVTNSTVKAVALNLTITGVRKTGGYVLAYVGSRFSNEWQTSSTMNPRAHETIANTTIVQTKPCATGWCAGQNSSVFSVYNGTATNIDFLVDIVGFYSTTAHSGATIYQALASPTRIVDTRSSLGAPAFGPATTHVIDPPGTVASASTAALAANVTAVAPTQNTFLSIWPSLSGLPRPAVSAINPIAGRTVANAALISVGQSEDFNVYNASGRTDVLVDVAGTFANYPVPPPAGPAAKPQARSAGQPGDPAAAPAAVAGAIGPATAPGQARPTKT